MSLYYLFEIALLAENVRCLFFRIVCLELRTAFVTNSVYHTQVFHPLVEFLADAAEGASARKW